MKHDDIHSQRFWNQKYTRGVCCEELYWAAFSAVDVYRKRQQLVERRAASIVCSGLVWDRPSVAMVGCGQACVLLDGWLLKPGTVALRLFVRDHHSRSVHARCMVASTQSSVRPSVRLDAMPYSSSNQSVIDRSAIAVLRSPAAACPKLDPYTTSSASAIQHIVIDFRYFDNVRLMPQECHTMQLIVHSTCDYAVSRLG